MPFSHAWSIIRFIARDRCRGRVRLCLHHLIRHLIAPLRLVIITVMAKRHVATLSQRGGPISTRMRYVDVFITLDRGVGVLVKYRSHPMDGIVIRPDYKKESCSLLN